MHCPFTEEIRSKLVAGVKEYSSFYMTLEHFNYILQTMCILQFRNLCFKRVGYPSELEMSLWVADRRLMFQARPTFTTAVSSSDARVRCGGRATRSPVHGGATAFCRGPAEALGGRSHWPVTFQERAPQVRAHISVPRQRCYRDALQKELPCEVYD